MKKNIIVSLLVVLILIWTNSCTKYINKNPLSSISIDEAYGDDESFQDALTGIYSQFYSLAPSFVTLTELRGDNFTHYQWLQDAYSNNNFGTYDSDELWDGLYNIISRSNILINKLSEVGNVKDSIQLQSEARFLRGYAFFWLVRSYGEVPIVDISSSLEESLKISRSPIEKVYEQIENDLKYAVDNLNDEIVFGKANKYVAESELAKVYIMESGYPVNQNKYDKAIPLLESIINSNEFELEASYKDIFSLKGEKGKEIIWSAIMDGSSRGHQHSGQYIIDPNESDLVMACSPEFKPGQSALLGDLWLSFEEGDKRRSVSLDSASFDPTGAFREQVNCAKYKYGYEEGRGWTSDYIFTRYANVLLMYAECLNKTGQSGIVGDEWDILNMIRNRAGLADLSDHGNFDEKLLKERRHEFVWEGTRWFDLVRTNTFKDKLREVGHSNVDDFWKFLPIPINEMDKMNGFWENNEGY